MFKVSYDNGTIVCVVNNTTLASTEDTLDMAMSILNEVHEIFVSLYPNIIMEDTHTILESTDICTTATMRIPEMSKEQYYEVEAILLEDF